jgi:hypothetical protein
MNFYPKPSKDLVYDLVNEANPLLPIPLSPEVVRLELLKPIAGAGPSDVNTTITVSASRGMGYRGTKVLSYRRINIGNFFRNKTVIVNKYVASGQPSKFSDYLADFNAKYGLGWTAGDFTDALFSASSIDPMDNRKTAAVFVNTKPDSLGFIGAFTFYWKNAPQELKNVILKTEIPGRVYPANNFVNMMTYGGDNTATCYEPVVGTNYKLIEYFAAGLLLAGPSRPDLIAEHTRFISLINAQYGTTFTVEPGQPMSKDKNLYKAVIDMVALPSALYPTANSKDFQKLLVLKLQPEHTWGSGDLFFHHNYGV